ncbi:rhodanese-like domain-containing protein [Lysinibacillus sp. BW-2-10]|uniref:rhodanese-like domain-containing protein n=1 Tax=Lysinibacillus sp. BW-2-10 TaxID=2590030 RepID=UPI001180A077|nr:rhodanese-like domain-containing protein [Lysinibacillus sp. BW-2-10]TSI05974.1 rhodanese-like domain-containing protein [Lysinibacillus sp. BW-2-10]
MRKIFFTMMVFLLMLTGCNEESSYETISLADTQEKIDSGYLVLDVREPNEFEEGHIPGAINKPLSELQAGDFSNIDKAEKYIVICRSGNRSKTASDLLLTEGFEIINTSEGMSSWQGDIQ